MSPKARITGKRRYVKHTHVVREGDTYVVTEEQLDLIGSGGRLFEIALSLGMMFLGCLLSLLATVTSGGAEWKSVSLPVLILSLSALAFLLFALSCFLSRKGLVDRIKERHDEPAMDVA